jgi:hypothetical protein
VRSEGGSSPADYGDDVSAPDRANARRRAVTTGRARTTRMARNPTPASHSCLYPAHELLGTRAHTRAAGTRRERRMVANRHACTVARRKFRGRAEAPTAQVRSTTKTMRLRMSEKGEIDARRGGFGRACALERGWPAACAL